MREYDSLHSGIITRGQFLSSLSMLKINFSMKEADLLYEKYTNPEKENVMDKFADDIYIVLVVKTLKKIFDIKKYD